MRNIVLLLLFVISFNMIIVTTVGTLTYVNDVQEYERLQFKIDNLVKEIDFMGDEQIVSGSNRAQSTDLIPPIDATPTLSTALKYLGKGVSITVLGPDVNTQVEKIIYSMLRWFIAMLNLSMIVWVGVLMWAKVTHT